jgi:hypothetical protein
MYQMDYYFYLYNKLIYNRTFLPTRYAVTNEAKTICCYAPIEEYRK